MAGGFLNEKRAMVRMAQIMTERDTLKQGDRARRARRRGQRVTFRELATAWLEHLERDRGAKPSTHQNYPSCWASSSRYGIFVPRR
jgi:hypothetical protein